MNFQTTDGSLAGKSDPVNIMDIALESLCLGKFSIRHSTYLQKSFSVYLAVLRANGRLYGLGPLLSFGRP